MRGIAFATGSVGNTEKNRNLCKKEEEKSNCFFHLLFKFGLPFNSFNNNNNNNSNVQGRQINTTTTAHTVRCVYICTCVRACVSVRVFV